MGIQSLKLKNIGEWDSCYAPECITPLLSHTLFDNLTALAIDNTPIDNELLSYLAREQMPRLRKLSLQSCALTWRELAYLLHPQTAWLPQLESLELDFNPLEAEFSLLFRDVAWKNLQVLGLSETGIQPAGLRYLLHHPGLQTLEELALYKNQLDDQAIVHLCQEAQLPSLKRLELINNPIGIESIKALTHLENKFVLEELFLDNTNIGDQGVKQLVNNSSMNRLQTLSLSENGLGPETAGAMLHAPNLSALTSLNLSCNPINDEGVKKIIALPWLYQLRFLSMSGMKCHEETLMQLIYTPGIQNIEEFYFPEVVEDDEYSDMRQLWAIQDSPYTHLAVKEYYGSGTLP